MAILKAVVPAAGLGTRLYPATKSQAKEMLPLGTKPVIQHVVEELMAAGVEQVLIITGRKKRAIEDHFDADEAWLEELNNGRVDPDVWSGRVEIFYTRQSKPLGLGDAISRARAFCGDEPFVVALGDCAIMRRGGGAGVLQRMVEVFDKRRPAACVATYKVRPEDTSRYGILAPADEGADGLEPFAVKGLVEKPGPERAPSRWAISARYILTAEIFDRLEECRKGLGAGEELQLTDAINALAERGGEVVAVPLAPDEFRLDVGNFESYSRAFIRAMVMDPRHGPAVADYIRRLVAFFDGQGPDPDGWQLD